VRPHPTGTSGNGRLAVAVGAIGLAALLPGTLSIVYLVERLTMDDKHAYNCSCLI
jgi:hypothetical protein